MRRSAARLNVLKIAGLALVAVYFLQVVTPLRLHPDSIILLSIGETVAQGGGFLYHGHSTVFPPGYPALIAALIELHLDRVWVVVSVNVIFILIGLLALRRLFKDRLGEVALDAVCLLSLLSFVFVKYSTIPLTDSVFFGVSMCTLAVMQRGASHLTWRTGIGSLSLVIACICVRRIGIAMLPPLLLMILRNVSYSFGRLSVRMRVITLSVAAAIAAAMICVAYATSTLSDFTYAMKGHLPIEAVLGIAKFRLSELGEIAVNLPFSALPPIVRAGVPFIGGCALLLSFGGLFDGKQFGVIETYVLSYTAVIFVWPFYDPRFWLPVIPLLITYTWLLLGRFANGKIVPRACLAYVMLFVVMGIFSIVSNTAVSFSHSGFDAADVESFKAADAARLQRHYERHGM